MPSSNEVMYQKLVLHDCDDESYMAYIKGGEKGFPKVLYVGPLNSFSLRFAELG